MKRQSLKFAKNEMIFLSTHVSGYLWSNIEPPIPEGFDMSNKFTSL